MRQRADSEPGDVPVLADGVFLHTQPFSGPQSIQLKLPANVTCTHCTLQVMEWMSNHPAPCFYHHCADLSLSQSAPDGGFTDGGTPPPSDGGGTKPGPDGSMNGGPDGSTGFVNPNAQNGCACSTSETAPAVSGLAGFVAFAAWLTRRNRRRRTRR